MNKLVKPAGTLLTLAFLAWLAVLATRIVRASSPIKSEAASVAIVLGAAAYGNSPSPVFEERIKHGISLYKSRAVKKLIFTGGPAQGSRIAEATVAKRYAIENGVPTKDILTETLSHTTHENLLEARRLMSAHGLNKAIIVSDPLHLARALKMAADLQISATASPTPSTRYRSWRTKAGFLVRELYFYNHYLITGR